MVDQIRSPVVNGQIVVAPSWVRSQCLDDSIVTIQPLLSGAFLIRISMNPLTHSKTAKWSGGARSQ